MISPVRIGIDARKLHDFGIGTYIRNLLRHLARMDDRTEFVVFCRPEDRETLRDDPVPGPLAALLPGDEAGVGEHAEVVGDRRLAPAERCDQVAGAAFAWLVPAWSWSWSWSWS